jgi:hypothetical protein
MARKVQVAMVIFVEKKLDGYRYFFIFYQQTVNEQK